MAAALPKQQQLMPRGENQIFRVTVILKLTDFHKHTIKHTKKQESITYCQGKRIEVDRDPEEA